MGGSVPQPARAASDTLASPLTILPNPVEALTGTMAHFMILPLRKRRDPSRVAVKQSIRDGRGRRAREVPRRGPSHDSRIQSRAKRAPGLRGSARKRGAPTCHMRFSTALRVPSLFAGDLLVRYDVIVFIPARHNAHRCFNRSHFRLISYGEVPLPPIRSRAPLWLMERVPASGTALPIRPG